MVDIGTLSLIILLGMFALLAIGMPLGFASAFLAVVTLLLKFDVDILFRTFGQGPLSVLGQAVYRQMTNYVLSRYRCSYSWQPFSKGRASPRICIRR